MVKSDAALPGWGGISIGQARGILISWGKVHCAETEESFLLLEMQPEWSGSWCVALSRSWRACWQAVLPPKDCFSVQQLVKPWIESGEAGWSGCLSELPTHFFFLNSMSHLKEIHFHHRRNLKLNAASETETRLKWIQLCLIKVTCVWY